VPVPAGPLPPQVLERAERICGEVMKDPGHKSKDPTKQLAQGGTLLNRILGGLNAGGVALQHPDVCKLMEKVCAWLQSTYIDGGEPRERRRALAKKCDQLTTSLPPGAVSELELELELEPELEPEPEAVGDEQAGEGEVEEGDTQQQEQQQQEQGTNLRQLSQRSAITAEDVENLLGPAEYSYEYRELPAGASVPPGMEYTLPLDGGPR
jgi:hypothetical protein